jgi:solute carrier family 25 carnitine/acylcarnitine transporter 20/29
MPNVVGTGSTSQEAWRGLLCGVLFGVASPLAAHPLDTIKSQMQALPAAARGGALATLRRVLSTDGVRGLYRGLLPPLLGSAVYRSLQFFAYSATYTAVGEDPFLTAPVPLLGGLQPRVLLAGAAATTARAIIETPLEVVKVRQQLGVALGGLRELRTGFGLTWARLYIALGGFFALCDHMDRHHPRVFSVPVVGSFLKGGVCATATWVLAWPLEVVKNQVQSGLHDNGGGVRTRLAAIVRARGVVGLYRGIGPGMARSLLGNGAALASYDACRATLLGA